MVYIYNWYVYIYIYNRFIIVYARKCIRWPWQRSEPAERPILKHCRAWTQKNDAKKIRLKWRNIWQWWKKWRKIIGHVRNIAGHFWTFKTFFFQTLHRNGIWGILPRVSVPSTSPGPSTKLAVAVASLAPAPTAPTGTAEEEKSQNLALRQRTGWRSAAKG